MKAPPSFDPSEYDYGPATFSVRQILSEWAEIDWFAPPQQPDAAAQATRCLHEHQQRGRLHQPALFPPDLEVVPTKGGWAEFKVLCEHVRTQQGWDWKFGVLKRLSSAHSKARGWSFDAATHDASVGTPPRPGDLFVRFGEHVMWNWPGAHLPLAEFVPEPYREAASFYLGYADMDVIECIEWQLAERADRLEDNPFLPLLRCYAAGLYPFSVGSSSFILFGFQS